MGWPQDTQVMSEMHQNSCWQVMIMIGNYHNNMWRTKTDDNIHKDANKRRVHLLYSNNNCYVLEHPVWQSTIAYENTVSIILRDAAKPIGTTLDKQQSNVHMCNVDTQLLLFSLVCPSEGYVICLCVCFYWLVLLIFVTWLNICMLWYVIVFVLCFFVSCFYDVVYFI